MNKKNKPMNPLEMNSSPFSDTYKYPAEPSDLDTTEEQVTEVMQLLRQTGYQGALELDIEKYRPDIDHFDMSEEQKTEFLRTLCTIMRAFVDIGWGIDSTQRVLSNQKRSRVKSRRTGDI